MIADGVAPATSEGVRVPWVWWPAGLAVTAGLVLGIVTQVFQGELPEGWSVLANSGVMWAVGAFALGAAMPSPRWALVGGAVALVVASVAYYEAVEWFEDIGSDSTGVIVWSAAGIVAGSVFGVLGFWFARHGNLRYPALGVLTGTVFGEGIHLTWFVGNAALRAAGIAELVVAGALGCAAFVGATRSLTWRGVTTTVAITVGATVATLAAMKVIDAAFLAA